MPKNSSTMLNNSAESEYPCLVIFSPLHIMSAMDLSYMAFIMFRYVSFMPTCWEFLSSMNIEFCQMLFLNLLRWSYDFYSFFLRLYSMLIDLLIFNYPWIPWKSPTWPWCMIFLMYGWIQYTNILLRIFVSIFIKDIGL